MDFRRASPPQKLWSLNGERSDMLPATMSPEGEHCNDADSRNNCKDSCLCRLYHSHSAKYLSLAICFPGAETYSRSQSIQDGSPETHFGRWVSLVTAAL